MVAVSIHGGFNPNPPPPPPAGNTPSNVVAIGLSSGVQFTWTPASNTFPYTNYEVRVDPVPANPSSRQVSGDGRYTDQVSAPYFAKMWVTSAATSAIVSGISSLSQAGVRSNTLDGIPIRCRVRGWSNSLGWGPWSAYSNFAQLDRTLVQPIQNHMNPDGTHLGLTVTKAQLIQYAGPTSINGFNADGTATSSLSPFTTTGTLSGYWWEPATTSTITFGNGVICTLDNWWVKIDPANVDPINGNSTHNMFSCTSTGAVNLTIQNTEIDGGGPGGWQFPIRLDGFHSLTYQNSITHTCSSFAVGSSGGQQYVVNLSDLHFFDVGCGSVNYENTAATSTHANPYRYQGSDSSRPSIFQRINTDLYCGTAPVNPNNNGFGLSNDGFIGCQDSANMGANSVVNQHWYGSDTYAQDLRDNTVPKMLVGPIQWQNNSVKRWNYPQYQGVWSVATTYAIGDVVDYGSPDIEYICTAAVTGGTGPATDITHWSSNVPGWGYGCWRWGYEAIFMTPSNSHVTIGGGGGITNFQTLATLDLGTPSNNRWWEPNGTHFDNTP